MAAVAHVCDFVTDLSPAEICQLFYVLSAATVLAVAAVPDAAQRLLIQYGARSSQDTPASADGETCKGTHRGLDDINRGAFYHLISRLTSMGMIPHSWFIHFYILSISCTIYWAVQFVSHGTVFEFIARKQLSKFPPSMALEQVVLVWFCMGLQGARRLYEHLVVLQSSSSRMWIVHWLLGMAFYLCTSVSIWVEGAQSVQCSGPDCPNIGFPRLKVITASFVFLVAWLMQYRCHRYLSGLKKYSLPHNGLFRYLVCPHYTCECLLYLSLAVMAAPQGQLYNRTVICATLFVSINLGVTAHGTKLWYGEKFGSDKVQGKWRMIPIIF
ncbi:hypothetical protein F5B22DRAFT_148296 [Xylaria bambusicola]|uniref:uncharacterized protein n=1 Tax=Xylaria bambusicola TaxID=326684 RepID=UPI002008B84A|nr:uncharacterized protein F5B22DRAFT_148296 [Xylaria bambusicola]KAI0526232.1 hypothetical protein F5B22DRAFT_148296 [Xylaria bambusicola]